jgi:hypothetical protein
MDSCERIILSDRNRLFIDFPSRLLSVATLKTGMTIDDLKECFDIRIREEPSCTDSGRLSFNRISPSGDALADELICFKDIANAGRGWRVAPTGRPDGLY